MPRFFILRQGFWYKAWALSAAREGARCAILQISCKVLFMSEGHEEPKRGADEVESLLPIDEHVEEGQDAEGRKVRHRGIYLLPNLFTTANLFAGFYAIINAMNGNFYVAAAAVFVAMVLDSLDGRVARLTNTQSAFGAEYDSLSDMVAFGVAPALLAFEWALGSMGKVGWMVAFIYVAGAALRLARFNTQIGSVDKRYFIGLASPAAAGVVAGTVWAFSDFGIKGSNMAFAVAVLVAAAGMLMVSNIKYYSFKDLDLKGRVPFVAILAVVLVFAVVFSDPPRILLIIFLAYAASGPIQYLLQLRRRKTVD
jgi:CDP-diacylglycerol--serine O-phosphatidyltransferase